MRLLLATAGAALAAALTGAPALATTYYVAAGGSDSAAGTSQGSAWRTVGKVNATSLQPGDSVLFEGGSTFTDSTLMPRSSGASGAPIVFGSYGSGRASIENADGAVWFAGKSWLTFDRLRLTSAGASTGVFFGSGSAASTHITLSDSVVTGTTGIGVMAPNSGDADWTISGNTITNVGDSGVIMVGGPHTITRNTIGDVGTNGAISWGKHQIYAKGPDETISYNDLYGATNGQAVSIRYHGARVFGNTIHDVAAAIGFFDDDPSGGTSYVYGNRIWNVSNWGFYYDGGDVDFVIASNTWLFSNASEAVNVGPSGGAHVTIANNVFAGTYGSEIRGASTTVEHHNLFAGGSSNRGTGTGDIRAAAGLTAAPELAAASGSRVVDAGTANGVGLAYANSCNGSPLSYCGNAPDIGAVESSQAVAALAPPLNLAATAVTRTGVTLTWSAPGDPRVGGYDVLRDGAVVASAALPTATLSGLTCGTQYALSVRATGGGLTSDTLSTTATTAACATTAPAAGSASGGGSSAAGGGSTSSSSPSSGAAGTPTSTPLGNFTTAAPTTATAPAAALPVWPRSGSVVKPRFTVVAKPSGRVARVAFLLDGKRTCVDRAAPFSCALKAKPGRHTVAVQPLGARTTLVRVRVAG